MKPTHTAGTAFAVCLAALWAAPAVRAAEHGGAPAPADADRDAERIEEILVRSRRVSLSEAWIETGPLPAVDTAQSLKHAPGADVNRNGRLTGIAQYRGLYGDRVAVSLDGICPVGGGPNAMDAPLSYASPMITDTLRVQRGIAGVADAAEAIGGHVDARMDRGSFGATDALRAVGWLAGRYEANGHTRTTAGRLTLASRRHRLSVVSELDRADDIETPAGIIRPSALNRDRHDVSYAWRDEATEAVAFAGRLDTTETGTPSLPMDIRYIDTDLYGLSITRRAGSVTLRGNVGYNDVDHVMDNYTLRAAPPPGAIRSNHTTGRGATFGLSGTIPVGDGELTLGVDGRYAEHDAVITNPNDAAFRIDNFVDVERDLLGVYGEWRTSAAGGEWELGLRYNRVSTDAGEVAVNGLPPMMAMNAGMLADAFNAAGRSLDFGNLDAVAAYRRSLSPALTLVAELGSRTRAPAYQELYLWLPLQATGGLADGRTYVGNLALEAERSNELNLGLDWSGERFAISPQVYYRRIDDYIQGVPAAIPAADRMAAMMSGASALQFDNVDAVIYGADLAWRYALTDTVSLDGSASIVRGERRDADDELYRIAPHNATVAVSYTRDTYTLRGELIAYRGQDRVAAYNGEQPSAGYGLVNLEFVWVALPSLTLQAALRNALDREYRDHLTGLNRAGGSDIPVGERLAGEGRSVAAGFTWHF